MLPDERFIESEKCFRQLAEHINEAFWLTDWINNKVLYVSPGYERIWGRTPESLIEDGRSWAYSIHSDDRERVVESFLRNASSGRYDEVYRIIRDDGQMRWIHDRAFPILDEQERVYRVAGLSEDITSFKSIEEELRQSKEYLETLVQEVRENLQSTNASLSEAEEFMRAIFEGNADPMIITDLKDIVKDANPAMERVFGYRKDELVGKTFPGHIGFDDGKLEKWIEACRFGQGVTGYETIRRAKDGTVIPVSITVSPIRNSTGELTHLSFLYRDITERLKMEHALKESEEKHRSFIERANDGIAIIQDMRVKFVNPRLAEMIGYIPDQMLDRKVSEYVHPDELPRLVDMYTRRMAGEDVPDIYETYLISEDGKRIDLEVNVGLINYQGKSASLVIYRNITERKRVQETLRESEERYRTLNDNLPIGVFRVDPRGKILSVNSSLVKMLGYDSEEELLAVPGMNLHVSRESYERVTTPLKSVGAITDHEIQLPRKDGSLIWVSLSVRTVQDEDGSPSCYDGIVIDISERKQAEEMWRRSDELNRAITDSSPIGISVRSCYGRLLGYNKSWKRIWNIPDEDVIKDLESERGELTFDERDEYLGKWLPEVRRVYENGGSLHIPELKTVGRRKGSTQWVSCYFYSIDNIQGEVEKVVILTEDITERKQAQEELDKNQRELQALFAGVDVLLWSIREGPDGELYYEQVNDSFAAVEGHTPEHYNGKAITQLHPPEECARIKNSFEWAKRKEIHSYEVNATNGSGHKFFEIRIIPLVDPDGRIRRFIGAGLDITERKHAEVALRKEREAFSIIAEAAVHSQDIPDLCDRVISGLVNALEFDVGSIQLYIEQDCKLYLKAAAGIWKNAIGEEGAIQSIDNPKYVGTHVARSLQPVFAPNVAQHEIYSKYRERLDELGVKSLVIWPILGTDRKLLGIIHLVGWEQRDIPEGDRRFVETVVEMFATALERKIAEEQVRERVKELQAVNQLSIRLTDAGPDEDVFAIIADELKKITGALATAVSIYTPGTQELVVKHIAVKGRLLKQVNRFLGRNLVGMKMNIPPQIRNQMLSQVVKITDNLAETSFGAIPASLANGVKNLAGLGVQAGIALKYKDELVGTVTCIMPRNLPSPSVGLLNIVSNVVAVSLQRKKVQDELRESEERYRVFTEEALVGVYIYHKGRLLFANPVMEQITGYSRDELQTMDTSIMEIPDHLKTPEMWEEKKIQEDPEINHYFMHLLRKDGQIAVLEFRTHPILFDDKKVTLGNCVDITERKNAGEALRKSEEKHRLLLGSIQSPVLALNKDMAILYCNQAYSEFVGLPLNELEGKKLLELFPNFEQTKSYAAYLKVLMTGEPVEVEGKVDEIHMHSSVYPAPWGILAIATDVTAYKNAEEKLRQALDEKEALLKEIHHRVKNNLQVISSLLKLQAEKTTNGDAQDALLGGINRIKSMAIIHEKLYQSQDLAWINMGEYLEELVNSLLVSYGKRAEKVDVQFDIAQVSLGIDKAIPCALIVNELVTNSLKHAFPEARKGKINIGLLPATSESYELTVSDNGIGMSENLDLSSMETLGLQLVDMLVRQLRGSMKLKIKHGTKFRIRFPKGKK